MTTSLSNYNYYQHATLLLENVLIIHLWASTDIPSTYSSTTVAYVSTSCFLLPLKFSVNTRLLYIFLTPWLCYVNLCLHTCLSIFLCVFVLIVFQLTSTPLHCSVCLSYCALLHLFYIFNCTSTFCCLERYHLIFLYLLVVGMHISYQQQVVQGSVQSVVLLFQ